MNDGANHASVLEQQQVLASFGEFALRADNLDDVLVEACRLVGSALRTDLAKVMELSGDGGTMVVRAGVGWRPGLIGTTVPISASSPEGLTLEQGAVISPSIEAESRFQYHDFMIEHGVKAFVNVLIAGRGGGQPFGVLEVDSRSQRDFMQTDIDFLRLYANLLGAAVERLRAVKALRTAVVEKKILLDELDHRVKNMLATVQSVVLQTLRQTQNVEQAKSDIEGRLTSLAQVHGLLTRERRDEASIQEIVVTALAPYHGRGENRIRIAGADVRLPPRLALALAMMLQELATNAIKYGALSTDRGIVTVDWSLDATGDPERLFLRWEESVGPPVQPPSRRGFGSRLIERSLAHEVNGRVQIEYPPEGLVCTLEAPVR